MSRARSIVLAFDPIDPDPSFPSRAQAAALVLEPYSESRYALAFAAAMDAKLLGMAELIVEAIEARGWPHDILD